MYRILLLVGISLLSGCTSFGSPEYGCSGLPEGVRCMATRDLYDATNGGEKVVRGPSRQSEDVNQRDSGQSSQARDNDLGNGITVEPITDPVIDTFVTPLLPNRPIPIRTPAQVMRIWVATWEDTNSGALIAPGYIYTEIEPRRWVIGKPESAASQQGRVFKPLDVPAKL